MKLSLRSSQSRYAFALAAVALLVSACNSTGPTEQKAATCVPPPQGSSSARASAAASKDGAAVVLQSVACATVPAGGLSSGQRVTLRQSEDQPTHELLATTGVMYGLQDALPYELRLTVGSSPPAPGHSIAVGFDLTPPSGGVAGGNLAPMVLAQVIERSSLGLLDQFEALTATEGRDGRLVVGQVPPYAFTDQRSDSNGSYEAIIAAGWAIKGTAVPVFPGNGASTDPAQSPSDPSTTSIDGTSFPCPQLGPPIQGWDPTRVAQHVSSGFGLRGPTAGPHYGVDFAVPVGSAVVSPVSGTVVAINFQYNPNRPGTVTQGSGWGEYVVLQSADGSLVLLAHLEGGVNNIAPGGEQSPIDVGLNVGDQVAESQIVGYSDTTGGATGPHLHMEVVTSGSRGQFGRAANKFKINPMPCFNVVPSSTPNPVYPKKISGDVTVTGCSANTEGTCAPGTMHFNAAVSIPGLEYDFANPTADIGGCHAPPWSGPAGGTLTFTGGRLIFMFVGQVYALAASCNPRSGAYGWGIGFAADYSPNGESTHRFYLQHEKSSPWEDTLGYVDLHFSYGS